MSHARKLFLSRDAVTRTQALVVIVIIVVAVVAGAAYYYTTLPPPLVERKIRIGFVTPLTGGASATGQDMQRGATIAVEEINAKGGVFVKDLGGRAQLELVIGDDQTTRDGGIAAVTRLITVEKVDVLIGGFSSAITLAMSPIAVENKVPWIITGSSTPQTTRRTDIDTSWLFHYQEVGDYQGASISSSLADIVKPIVAPARKLKVAFIYQDSAFGLDYFNGFKNDIQTRNLPIDIVYEGKFKLGETDLRPQLSAAWATKPDAIVPMGFGGETVNAITQGVRDLGITTIWGPVCTCADDPTYYKNLGRLGEYTLIQTLYSTYATPKAGAEKLEAFRKAYKDKWGTLAGSQGVTSYDAVYVMAKAIENGGSLDKAKIREALEKLEMPQLTLPVKGGTIKFDKVHEVRFDIYVTQLKWDASVNEPRPVVIWPNHLKTTDFVLPPGYTPGA